MSHARCTTASAPRKCETRSELRTSASRHSTPSTDAEGRRRANPSTLVTSGSFTRARTVLVPTLPVAPTTTTRMWPGYPDRTWLVAHSRAKLGERGAYEPRHVHLRDPDLVRDLRLREVLHEAQIQDKPVPLGQRAQLRRQRGGVLGQLVAGVLAAQLGDRASFLVLVARPRRLERHAVVRGGRLQRLEHLLVCELGRLGQLGGRGRAAERARQLGHGTVDLEHALLDRARHVHRPADVAEVALELAEDRGNREAGEGHAAGGVEAVHGLDETHARHLEEIVHRLVRALVAAGKLAR